MGRSDRYLFRGGTMVALGYVPSHGFSHRLDFLAQRYTRRYGRFNGISMTFILLNYNHKSRRWSQKCTEWSLGLSV